MNIFFKLLGVVGIAGTVGGATYLAKQEYTDRTDASSGSRQSTRRNGETVDIKRQPTMNSSGEKDKQTQQTQSSSGTETTSDNGQAQTTAKATK